MVTDNGTIHCYFVECSHCNMAAELGRLADTLNFEYNLYFCKQVCLVVPMSFHAHPLNLRVALPPLATIA